MIKETCCIFEVNQDDYNLWAYNLLKIFKFSTISVNIVKKLVIWRIIVLIPILLFIVEKQITYLNNVENKNKINFKRNNSLWMDKLLKIKKLNKLHTSYHLSIIRVKTQLMEKGQKKKCFKLIPNYFGHKSNPILYVL